MRGNKTVTRKTHREKKERKRKKKKKAEVAKRGKQFVPVLSFAATQMDNKE